MHKIHAKEFTLEDFSFGKLIGKFSEDWDSAVGPECRDTPLDILCHTIDALNVSREKFLEAQKKPMKDESKRAGLVKKYWWQMIQLLPTSYNQKRTIMLNYEVLVNIYTWRKNHKLDEWHVFCDWIESLPYSELIIGEKNEH